MALSLLVESWTWFAVVCTVLCLRMISRVVALGGIFKLKPEDYLMLLAFAAYTNVIVWMNIVATEQSNLLPPGYLKTHILSALEIANRSYGSKITMVVEQCQIITIWTTKVCLLLMYYRITRFGYPKHCMVIKALFGYVLGSFIVMEILYFGVWCRPIQEYWAVPTSDPEQCAAAINHLITNAVFNLSSDIIMIATAFSVIYRVHFSRGKKWGLCGLVLMGFFVVACATANKIYSFTNPYGVQWTFWYIRESSTAMLIANLAYLGSLFNRLLGKPTTHGRRSSSWTGDRGKTTGVSRFAKFSSSRWLVSNSTGDAVSRYNISAPYPIYIPDTGVSLVPVGGTGWSDTDWTLGHTDIALRQFGFDFWGKHQSTDVEAPPVLAHELQPRPRNLVSAPAPVLARPRSRVLELSLHRPALQLEAPVFTGPHARPLSDHQELTFVELLEKKYFPAEKK